jgi:hypothetical protein
VRNSGQNGLQNVGAVNIAVDLSRFEGNGPSSGGCGVNMGANGIASIRDSVASGNSTGFCVSGTGAQLSLQNSMATNNVAGSGVFAAIGTARVGGSIATANGLGFTQSGAGVFESLGNNLVQGNGTDTSGTITVVSGK